MMRLSSRLGVLALLAGVLLGNVSAQAPGSALKSDSKVKVKVEAGKPNAAGKQELTVTIDITDDWHIYANPVGQDLLASNATVLKVKADGKPIDVDITYPKGDLVRDADIGDFNVYKKKVTLKGVVDAPKNAKLEVSVKVTACNEKTKNCLQPATVALPVP